MERYKKTVFSALWVHITLLTCYLPFAVVVTLITIRGLSSSLFLAQGWAFTLVYLNSSLNPAFYCWKIKEVRQAMKETIRQLTCFRFHRDKYVCNRENYSLQLAICSQVGPLGNTRAGKKLTS